MATIYDFNTAGPQVAESPAPRPRLDAPKEFRDACVNAGLLPGDVEASGGRVVRCPAAGDKPGKKSGWFVFFNDDLPAGAFGDWRNGESGTWCAKSETVMSPAEVQAYRYKMDKAREAREAERARLAEEARQSANEQWGKAAVAEKHPYLEKKGVSSFGLKLLSGKLLVPMQDTDGVIHGLQSIDAGGEKRFSFGCEKKGKFHLLPGSGKAAVCEGYATAASVYMATGWNVLVAFDAGNLSAVAEAWRKGHPQDDMLICGDDDAFTASNPGKAAAESAAKACGAVALLPDFSGFERGRATDWNDLHALAGLDAVKRQLGKEREYKVRITDWLVGDSLLQKEPKKQEWLIDKTFTMASVNLLAAMGGAGKSMLALDLAIKVASAPAPEWSGLDFNSIDSFGNAVITHGPVAMFTAEDNKDDVHRRLWSLQGKPAHPFVLVPLPSAGGPMPFVLPGGKDGPQPSLWWHEIKAQLVQMGPKLIIFDPLASFALVDLNKPEVADFTMSLFASLADETGACVLVTHHLAKTRDNIATPEAARTLVRGSTAIVDRTRSTYVLWSVGEAQGKEICEAIGEEWSREKVYRGCVAKENSGGDKSIKTFVRSANGLLTVRDAVIKGNKAGITIILEDALVSAIASAAEALQPFTRTGANGIMERKAELPKELHGTGRPAMLAMLDKLLLNGRVVTCIPIGGTTKNRLDVPGGPIAMAQQKIQPGSGEV